jgi:hypothetical protein
VSCAGTTNRELVPMVRLLSVMAGVIVAVAFKSVRLGVFVNIPF